MPPDSRRSIVTPAVEKTRTKGMAFGLAAGLGIALFAGMPTPLDAVAQTSPPGYIIEAYHEVDQLFNKIGTPGAHKARLQDLFKKFQEAKANWKPLLDPGKTTAEVTETVAGEADRFWTEAETKFLPAFDRDDKEATFQSYERLTKIYAKDQSSKGADPEQASSFSSAVESTLKSQPRVALFLGIVLAVLALVLVFGAIVMITLRIVRPVVSGARTRTQATKERLRLQAQAKAEQNLEINLAALRTRLYKLGDPRREADNLFFGTHLVNGDNAIVDQIKVEFGGNATIFSGDKRVATNVLKPDGSRATATALAPGPAYEAVLKQAEVFRGEVMLFGNPILAIYEPIIRGNRVIGILFVGVKKRYLKTALLVGLRSILGKV